VGDLNDGDALARVFQRYRPTAVLHFAALAYVSESVLEPGAYYRNNVCGTLSLLEAMRRAEVSWLVFSSSCSVYGIPESWPITETHRLAPINPYGASKMAAERMLCDFDASYAIRSVALRYFNAAGADPDGEIGEFHEPETHAIPLLIRAALGGQPFRIYGTDYPTPDGSAVRDYVHVSDLATAHVAALQYLVVGGATDAVNLGSGTGTSVLELVGVVERLAQRSVPIVRDQRRPGDPPVLVAQPNRARSVLGWRPSYMCIDDIVATAWSWHKRKCGKGIE
jgi:UDP-glucose-4-epimerase GalE